MESHLRYIERKLREYFGFGGTPLKIHVRPKKRDA
jgi:predicted GTPase